MAYPAPPLNAVLDALVEGVLVIDRHHRIVYSNLRAAELLGAAPDDLDSALDRHARHEDGTIFLPHELPTRRCLASGEPQRHVTVGFTRPDGSPWWVRMTAQPLTPGEHPPAAVVLSMTDVTPGVEHKRRLEQALLIDRLSGLLSRVGFEAALERRLDPDAAPGADFALAFLDLDGFKAVNDTYGHAAGDTLLRAVGERVRELLRPDDLAARLHGDEFAVLFAQVTAAQGHALARALMDAAAHPVALPGGSAQVSCSVGMTWTQAGDRTLGDVLRRADTLMYEAKRAGKARIRLDQPHTGNPDVDDDPAD